MSHIQASSVATQMELAIVGGQEHTRFPAAQYQYKQ
jgi:hypothetical protein